MMPLPKQNRHPWTNRMIQTRRARPNQLLRWLVLVFPAWVAAAGIAAPAPDAGQPVSVQEQKERVARGHSFLIGLFDPELSLLPEFRGSKTYWLFHDNYLAARTLAQAQPELSERIRVALARFGVTNSGKIEIVFNEARQPLPFRAYQLTNVARIHEKLVRTEALTTNLLTRWEAYADLLLLASMVQADSAPQQARSCFDRAAAMWDGNGFKDHAAQANGIYATYKLALYLIAAERLKIQPPHSRAVLDRLLAMQSKEGGWITDYKQDRPVGVANVETTCLAILALQTTRHER